MISGAWRNMSVTRFGYQLGLILLLVVCDPVLSQSEQAPAMEPWLADFNQLLNAISLHYANFEWLAHDRHVNLPLLKQRTEDRLRSAKSDAERRQAIESFLHAFADAHVEVRWELTGADHSARPPSAMQPFCDRLGYDWQDSNGGIDWSIVPEFTGIRDSDSQDFPAGILRLPGKPALGVIRIGWFSEYAHPGICRAAQRERAISDEAPCDNSCQEQFQLGVADLLTGALERRIRSLEKDGAAQLMIDVTGNGGGTNWVEPAARVLSPIHLKSPRYAFVKDQHWVKQLRERLTAVQADLAEAPVRRRQQLEDAAATLRHGIDVASKPCALTAYWQQQDVKPGCSNLEANLLYTSGILPYAEPGEFAGLKSRWVFFYPSRYDYAEGTNHLPLIILVDSDTGSSAEYFSAMLQDNKAATIVGQVTVGAGCGFTDGGIKTRLDNSGADVRLPDCARLRSDGSNEVSGIVPDILLPWVEKDSRYQQAMKLKRWLESSWSP